MMLAAATAATAEAGSIGTGQNVPWWYPSRLWGMDRDAGSGWGSYYDGSPLWRKKRRNRGEAGGGGAGWPPQDPYLRWRAMELADLAREFVQGCVARGLGEEEERTGDEPQCSAAEAWNVTLRRLGENVDRCASPFYSLTEIHPSQLVYTEVDPAVEAARYEEQARRNKEALAKREEEERLRRANKEGGEEEADDILAGAGEPEQGQSFLGIFLFLKGDFFSVELESALTAVAPAYPGVWIVKANAKAFLSFCVQYHLYTFPQLLLFKNGRLVSSFRGRRTVHDLAHWLSRLTGELPRALPRRALPLPPLANPLSIPGPDEPITWAALLYAAIKLVRVFMWLVRTRRERQSADSEVGGRQAGVVGRAKRLGQWLVSLVWTRRDRRGHNRLIVAR